MKASDRINLREHITHHTNEDRSFYLLPTRQIDNRAFKLHPDRRSEKETDIKEVKVSIPDVSFAPAAPVGVPIGGQLPALARAAHRLSEGVKRRVADVGQA